MTSLLIEWLTMSTVPFQKAGAREDTRTAEVRVRVRVDVLRLARSYATLIDRRLADVVADALLVYVRRHATPAVMAALAARHRTLLDRYV